MPPAADFTFYDLIQNTSLTIGLGPFTLLGPTQGHLPWSIVPDGTKVYYNISDGINVEVGKGVISSTGTILTRTTVLTSTNSNALVNFPAGVKKVALTVPAEFLNNVAAGGGGGSTTSLTNSESGSVVIGAPVYCSTAGHFLKARANSSSTKNVIGLVADASIAASAAGKVQAAGVLTATTGQWDAVAGTTGGLTAGTKYYLSAATAGLLTATAPSTRGQYIKEIGEALSTTQLLITLEEDVLL